MCILACQSYSSVTCVPPDIVSYPAIRDLGQSHSGLRTVGMYTLNSKHPRQAKLLLAGDAVVDMVAIVSATISR